MKRLKTIPCLLLHGALALWVAGCTTVNVNPPEARAHTGYVDLHAESAGELSWEVTRFDERKQTYKAVFTDYDPLQAPVLRLAFPPGHYRLRVNILNRLVVNPGEAEVDILDGKVVPVRITLAETGTAMVETKAVSRGSTAYGRYGRRTRIGSDAAVMYAITANVGEPVAYQPKERMPYAR
jgi:hypothetical protein